MSGPSLFLIAGEPSGDRLGAALMAGLKELAPGTTFQGIGGPLMQAEGLTSCRSWALPKCCRNIFP
jgi:lipid-A-disaccharide synthase